MKDNVLLGFRKHMMPVPSFIWRRQVKKKAVTEARHRLSFMAADHHRVRDYVVKRLHRNKNPLSPSCIARGLQLPIERVNAILDELENQLIFLYRCGTESVVWAYPVTVVETPHEVTFTDGEQGYAA